MIGGKIGWVDGEMRGKVGGRGGSSHFTLTLSISPIAFSLVGDGGEDLIGGKVGARGGGFLSGGRRLGRR